MFHFKPHPYSTLRQQARFLTSFAALALAAAGCMSPASHYAADVYQADQINTRQEAKAVRILSIEASKVQVENKRNQELAAIGGAILGGLLGAELSSNTSHGKAATLGGGLVGATVAENIAVNTVLVDGVSLFYEQNGTILTSTQVGQPCQFAPGTALMIVTQANNSRIQPNAMNPCVKGQEQVTGKLSRYDYDASAQEMLKLGRQPTHSDKMMELKRQQQTLEATKKLQKEITELTKEEQRSATAKERANLEVEQRKAEIDSIKSRNEATRTISEGIGNRLNKDTEVTIEPDKVKIKN